MKLLVLLSLFAIGSCSLQTAVFSLLGGQGNGQHQYGCDVDCRDRLTICTFSLMKRQCERGGIIGYYFKSLCARTCGLCTPCVDIAPRICDPANDTCVDNSQFCPSIMAPRYCHGYDWSGYVQNICPKSCHMCTPCSLPLSAEKACDNDCEDVGEHCPYWKEQGFCAHHSTHYRYMNQHCNRTCGICQPCGRPPVHPSPAYLPPATRKPSVPKTAPTRKPVATRRPATRRPPATRPVTRRPETKRPDNVLKTCRRPETNGLSQADQCLSIHNYYRCLHGVPELIYDVGLQRSAQLYANKLASIGYLEPSTPGAFRGSNVGENLAMKTVRNNAYTLGQAVTEWYAEGMFYDYNSEEATSETAQFTQLIWRDTIEVGCAIRKVGNNFYAVAHYREAGNEPGLFMDNIPMPHEGRCDAFCLDGSCVGEQGNTRSPRCACNTRLPDFEPPRCGGPCVAMCPRPRFHVGEWETTCEGAVVCTCNKEGNPEAGIAPGAVCR